MRESSNFFLWWFQVLNHVEPLFGMILSPTDSDLSGELKPPTRQWFTCTIGKQNMRLQDGSGRNLSKFASLVPKDPGDHYSEPGRNQVYGDLAFGTAGY